MDHPSPPSSPPPQTPPSSPFPASSISYYSSEAPTPKKQRTWEVYRGDSGGLRLPARTTLHNWEKAGTSTDVKEILEVSIDETRLGLIVSDSSIISAAPPPNDETVYNPQETVYNPQETVYNPQEHVASDSSPSHENVSETCESHIRSSCSSSVTEDSQSDSEEENFDQSDREHTHMCSDSDSVGSVDREEDLDRELMLYEGSDYTVKEGVRDMIEKFIKNKQTQTSLHDDLAFQLKYLPQPNHLPKSMHHLLKFVRDQAPLCVENEHIYCSKCFYVLCSSDSSCPKCKCKKIKQFYRFSIERQVKHYFEKCRLFELLIKRNVSVEGAIRDITDGSEYLRVQTDCLHGITLLVNTDGVSLSKSSRTTLYPLMFVICEIPPHLRSTYMIVSGVWCDDVKPCINMFFRPFVDELLHIHQEGGVRWIHPDTQEVKISTVVAPAVCADAPVRAEIQNITSHTGIFSCNTCEQGTEQIPLTPDEVRSVEDGQSVRRKRAFLYKENAVCLRNNEQMSRQAVSAFSTKTVVQGVKGISVLSLLPYLDLSTCVYGEYMHLVCLGVVRRFMTLWFTEKGGPWYVGNHTTKVDEFLLSVKPSSIIGRLPRGVSDINSWKASEFRAFLLYYSLVVMSLFLSDAYLQHWMLLVAAIYLLLQENITLSDIEKAESMLNLFVKNVSRLYRPIDNVYNVHELLHLPLYVKRWGPLWASSAFTFEKYNGVLCNFIHGTKNKGKELINNIKTAHGHQVLKQKVRDLVAKKTPMYDSHVQLLDKREIDGMTDENIECLRSFGRIADCIVYSRMRDAKGEVFTSLIYSREKKRNNYTIAFEEEGCVKYGEIRFFVKQKCESGQNAFFFVKKLNVCHVKIFYHADFGTKVKHIIPIEASNDDRLLRPQNILTKVIRVGDFVCRPPNLIEKNL